MSSLIPRNFECHKNLKTRFPMKLFMLIKLLINRNISNFITWFYFWNYVRFNRINNEIFMKKSWHNIPWSTFSRLAQRFQELTWNKKRIRNYTRMKQISQIYFSRFRTLINLWNVLSKTKYSHSAPISQPSKSPISQPSKIELFYLLIRSSIRSSSLGKIPSRDWGLNRRFYFFNAGFLIKVNLHDFLPLRVGIKNRA